VARAIWQPDQTNVEPPEPGAYRWQERQAAVKGVYPDALLMFSDDPLGDGSVPWRMWMVFVGPRPLTTNIFGHPGRGRAWQSALARINSGRPPAPRGQRSKGVRPLTRR